MDLGIVSNINLNFKTQNNINPYDYDEIKNKYFVIYKYDELHDNINNFINLYNSLIKKNKNLLLTILRNIHTYNNIMVCDINISFTNFISKLKFYYHHESFLKKKWCKKYLSIRGTYPDYSNYKNKNLLN